MEMECVGQGNYQIKPGDCLISIAAEYGFFWETLWNLPENAQLKRVRKDPNVLLSGDLLTVPERRHKDESCAVDARHSFVRRGTPAKLIMHFVEDGEPLAGEEYVLDIDGEIRTGQLDGNGGLREVIKPNARRILLTLGDDEPFEIALGTLDPVTTISGIQGRLRNLGFAPGAIDGVPGPKTKYAVQLFQESQGLEPTGAIDGALQESLLKAHGS